ncbi:hypothetical protein NQ317_014122 [Molorchus minor]|uniref:Transposable element P transposase-like RNase H domain-containing protein n=1 Tax=Molorchus minor TaxID=1323400 RepID=A0ABQ9JM32_9CUCU|nr:hypothetical protein NQ317_014122 [Molorchus minor]
MSELSASSFIGRLKYSCKYPSCKNSYYSVNESHAFAENVALGEETKDELLMDSDCSNEVKNGTSLIPDHSYYKSIPAKNKKGFLTKVGLSKKDLTPQEEVMYREHRNVTSKLSKLRNLLNNERAHVNSLRNLYNDGRFQFIEENLNELPSVRTLKEVLAAIPFECGMIQPVLEHLRLQTEKMDELDRCCTLIFDEISLSCGFHYDVHQQKVYGFEDLGILGRNDNVANHALVFMIRGVKKNYKMPVGFFFTRDTIKTVALKDLIVDAIKQLQGIGLDVATVCD